MNLEFNPRLVKRIVAAVASAAAAFALIPAAASAAPIQSPTSPWIQYQPPSLGVSPFIYGGFSSTKKACNAERLVDIYRSADGVNYSLWKTELLSSGGFTYDVGRWDDGAYFQVSVAGTTVRNRKGKRINCLPGQTEIYIPNDQA
jgi:hypothetical protein